MKTFGERLKISRLKQKLTQKELAELMDVSNSSVSEWENNKHRPSIEQVKQLCDILKIDPNWLYGDTYSRMIRETPSNYYTLEDGEELPEEAKKELDSFIEYLKMKYKKGEQK